MRFKNLGCEPPHSGGGGALPIYVSIGMFSPYMYSFQLCDYMIRYVFKHQLIIYELLFFSLFQ